MTAQILVSVMKIKCRKKSDTYGYFSPFRFNENMIEVAADSVHIIKIFDVMIINNREDVHGFQGVT